MSSAYDVQEVERRWHERWAADRTYEVDPDDRRPTQYILCMYPYPSGAAHQGHIRNYTFGDLLVRYRTMQGYAVLSPFGFDSFGLPAENAAIRGGATHPRAYTEDRIAELKTNVIRLGAVYDWRRELRSHDPDYMRWNQVIFLRLLERDLAYRAEAPVNWCPGCQTVLANEQVLADGTCERSGDVVVRRNLEQWFLRITNYADELLEALDGLEWPERVKVMQHNWIGRSEGAQFSLEVQGRAGIAIEVYTTRPDTGFGMTYVVLAPDHPLVDELITAEQREEVDEVREGVAELTELERMATESTLGKRGAFTGTFAINPFNNEPVPIYIADYVLMGYGTGAIMAVPAEDERDFDFATDHGLPVVRTVAPPADFPGGAYSGDGLKINSGFLDGLDVATAEQRATEWLEQHGIGHRAVKYKLRDWLISRQRYWGCPIPVVYCEIDGIVPVPEADLPVLLPEDVEFTPTGESPLNSHQGFLHADCPRCGGPARRETDTMDTFVDSSWYFFRFCDPHNEHEPFALGLARHFMPVDQYIGGITHAILHLLYARFYTALGDVGLGPQELREPFQRLFCQGMIRMEGRAMSKSKGNLISPTEYFETVGADALRLFHLFVGPPEDDADWSEQSDEIIHGCGRFLDRVWRLTDGTARGGGHAGDAVAGEELRRTTHQTIAKVSADIERFAFNTAVAALMDLTNAIYRQLPAQAGEDGAEAPPEPRPRTEAIDALLRMLAPMAPHIAAEAWEKRHGAGTNVHTEAWPVPDAAMLRDPTVTMVVQVNGKLVDKIEVDPAVSEEEARRLALSSVRVSERLSGAAPSHVIARPPRLVNVVP